MGRSTFDKWDVEEEAPSTQEAPKESIPAHSPEPDFEIKAALEAEIREAKSLVPDSVDSEAQLIMVRRSYNKKLPAELDDMEKLLDAARNNPKDQSTIEKACRTANTLRGMASTLGFIDISQAVGRIEDALKLIVEGAPSNEETWEGLANFFQQARQAPERPSLLDVTPLHFVGIATFLVADEKLGEVAAIDTQARRNLIQIVPVTDPDEAVAKLHKRHFDGAIIDTEFGDGKGAVQLAQHIRSAYKAGGLPMAFMSTNASMQSRVAASHAGAAQFVKKPLSGDELVELARYFNSIRSTVQSKVMIVDNDESFRAHVETILGYEGIEVASLGNPEETIETIEKVHPDLILLEVKMPTVQGYDICRMIRSTSSWKDLPIIFLTSETGHEVRLERARLSKERADRDGLTGLPNRRAFLDMMRLRIEEGRRYKRPVSLCLLDLDKFKHINDTYGHIAGDRVLASLGKLLSSRFRAVDVRGRWGGEEFSVAFYGEDVATSQIILQRVLAEFREMPFESDRGEMFTASFSGGIAAFPRDGSTFEDLFRVADDRLYVAKETGRNRIAI